MKSTTCELVFEGIFTYLLPWSSWTKATSITGVTKALLKENQMPGRWVFPIHFSPKWIIFLKNHQKNLNETTTKDVPQGLIFHYFPHFWSKIIRMKPPPAIAAPPKEVGPGQTSLGNFSLPPLRPTNKRSPSRIMSYLFQATGVGKPQKLRKVKTFRLCLKKHGVFGAGFFLRSLEQIFWFLFTYFVSEP